MYILTKRDQVNVLTLFLVVFAWPLALVVALMVPANAMEPKFELPVSASELARIQNARDLLKQEPYKDFFRSSVPSKDAPQAIDLLELDAPLWDEELPPLQAATQNVKPPIGEIGRLREKQITMKTPREIESEVRKEFEDDIEDALEQRLEAVREQMRPHYPRRIRA